MSSGNGNGHGNGDGNGNGNGPGNGHEIPPSGDRFSMIELTKPRLFSSQREVIQKTGIARNFLFFIVLLGVSTAYLGIPQESVRDAKALVVPSRRVDFSSPRDGFVERLLFQEGDRVEKGETIVIVSSPEDPLLLNQAGLESEALAREIAAEKDEARVLSMKVEEARKLHVLGSAKGGLVAEAKLRLLSKKKRIEALRAKLALSSARLEELMERISLGQIRAPFRGKIISDVGVKEKTFVKAGDFLFTLAGEDSLVEVLLKESDFGRIETGARARVKFYAFPGRTYQGFVAGFKHFAEPLPKSGITRHAVKALVRLNSAPPRIQNGMSAKIDLEAKPESFWKRFYHEMF